MSVANIIDKASTMSLSNKTCVFGNFACVAACAPSEDHYPCEDCRKIHPLYFIEQVQNNPPENAENARTATQWLQDWQMRELLKTNQYLSMQPGHSRPKHLCVTENMTSYVGGTWRASFKLPKSDDPECAVRDMPNRCCDYVNKRFQLCQRCLTMLKDAEGFDDAFDENGGVKFACIMRDHDYDDIPVVRIARRKWPFKDGKVCEATVLSKGVTCRECRDGLDIHTDDPDYQRLLKFMIACFPAPGRHYFS